MATGVASWSTTAGTNATADSAVVWSEGQAPSTVNDSARGMMASVAKWRDDLSGAITTGGSSTAYTVTTNQVFASLTVLGNRILTIIPHTTSGAAPTLAVDGLTAKAINLSTGVAVPTGFLVSGTPYIVYYGASAAEFIVLGTPAVFAGAFSGTTVSGTTATFSSTLACTGNFAVNTNKFTVTAASGNTLVAGTLDVTSDVAVATNKFTVAASSGNTVVAGTLAVTGAATLASIAGTVVATQTDQETSTSTTTAVSPGRQQFHPSASKCWIKCDHNGTTNASYNVTSITDGANGVVTVTIATDFSSAHYAVVATTGTNNVSPYISNADTAAGSFIIRGINTNSGAAQDSTTGYYAVAFGDQ